MAKLALIEREKKRAKTVAKYAGKRAELKAIIDDVSKSEEERYEARLKLQPNSMYPSNTQAKQYQRHCSG